MLTKGLAPCQSRKAGRLLKQSKIKDVYYFKYSLDNIYDFANVRDFFLDDLCFLKNDGNIKLS